MEYRALQDYSTNNYRRALIPVGTKTNPTSPNTFFEQPAFPVNELALDYTPKKFAKKKRGISDIHGLNRKSFLPLKVNSAGSDGEMQPPRPPSPDKAPPRFPGKTDEEPSSPELSQMQVNSSQMQVNRSQMHLNRSATAQRHHKPSFLKAFGSTFDQSSRNSSLSMGGATILTSGNLKRQNIIEEAIEYAPISTRHQIVFPFNLDKVNFDITAFEWYYHQADLLGMRVTESREEDEESHSSRSIIPVMRRDSSKKESNFKTQVRKDSLTPKKHPNGIQSDHE
jgi:hypothetical protein